MPPPPLPSLYDQRLKFQAEFWPPVNIQGWSKIVKKQSNAISKWKIRRAKLLAHQARTAALSRLIPRIKLPSGSVVTDPKLINEAFFEFLFWPVYLRVLTWNLEEPQSPGGALISQSGWRSGWQTGRSDCKRWRCGRRLGNFRAANPLAQMVFVVEFYKAYSTLITPHLANVYNESFNSGRLPPTLSEANISLFY